MIPINGLTSRQCLDHAYLLETTPRNNIPIPSALRVSTSNTSIQYSNGMTSHETPSAALQHSLPPPYILAASFKCHISTRPTFLMLLSLVAHLSSPLHFTPTLVLKRTSPSIDMYHPRVLKAREDSLPLLGAPLMILMFLHIHKTVMSPWMLKFRRIRSTDKQRMCKVPQ